MGWQALYVQHIYDNIKNVILKQRGIYILNLMVEKTLSSAGQDLNLIHGIEHNKCTSCRMLAIRFIS